MANTFIARPHLQSNIGHICQIFVQTHRGIWFVAQVSEILASVKTGPDQPTLKSKTLMFTVTVPPLLFYRAKS